MDSGRDSTSTLGPMGMQPTAGLGGLGTVPGLGTGVMGGAMVLSQQSASTRSGYQHQSIGSTSNTGMLFIPFHLPICPSISPLFIHLPYDFLYVSVETPYSVHSFSYVTIAFLISFYYFQPYPIQKLNWADLLYEGIQEYLDYPDRSVVRRGIN